MKYKVENHITTKGGKYIISNDIDERVFVGNAQNLLKKSQIIGYRLTTDGFNDRFRSYIIEYPDIEFTFSEFKGDESEVDTWFNKLRKKGNKPRKFKDGKKGIKIQADNDDEPDIVINIREFLIELGASHNAQWGEYERAIRNSDGSWITIDGHRFFLPDGWTVEDLPIGKKVQPRVKIITEPVKKVNAFRIINGKKYDLLGNRIKE